LEGVWGMAMTGIDPKGEVDALLAALSEGLSLAEDLVSGLFDGVDSACGDRLEEICVDLTQGMASDVEGC